MNCKYIDSIFSLFFLGFALWTVSYVVFFFIGYSFSSLAVLSVALIVLVIVLFVYRCVSNKYIDFISVKESVALILFVSLAIFLTLCLHRPDSDDQLYLNVSIAVLDYAKTIFKDIPVLQHRLHVIMPYELAKSSVTYIAGVPLLVSYYLILPGFLSVFVVIANYQLLKLLIGKNWIVGMVFFFIVMLVWGDIHRTYANFGFVRLFQGKAVLVSIIIPAIFYYYFKFAETLDKKNILFLAFTMVAGCGFTATGIVVCLIVLSILILSTVFKDIYAIKKYLLLFLCLIVPLALGLVMRFYFGVVTNAVHTSHGFQEHTTNYDMFLMMFGDGYRGFFAVACFVVSPFFVTNAKVRPIYRNFVIISVVLLMIPCTSEIIAKLTYPTLSWRWLWALPVPFAMSMVVGRLGGELFSRGVKGVGIRHVAALMLVLIFIFNSKPHVLSKYNRRTTLKWPSPKIRKNTIWLRLYKEYAVIEKNRICLKSSKKCF
ncbi:DUF6077 domain-containing protein [Desulfogranum japonicum]|uniref:DUF6077 domain-containing protein n=1 Tax=Desulfogranum japonicum TaxID=231447 RepID=UPI0003FC1AAE|nr:DUF6077 domain-containing protein [Desulfogranum japonicum]